MRRTLLDTIVLVILGVCVPAWAQPAPDVPDIQMNTHTASHQMSPVIAMDSTGNFVVVWESLLQDGSGFGVFGQRHDGAGVPQSVEFQANDYTTSSQRRPSVAMDDVGNFVVVWASTNQDGHMNGVFGQRFDSAGGFQGDEFQVNTYTTDNQQEPDVAMDAVGNFVVVWESYNQDTSSWGVFSQRYDNTGTELGGELRVNVTTLNWQAAPSVDMNSSGQFVAVWDSYAQDGSNFGVFAQRFNASGTRLGSEFQVNTHTVAKQYDADVAISDSGSFLVVWTDNALDGSSTGVFARLYDSAGSPQGAEFQVNTYTTGDQMNPSVAMDGTGHFMVVWQSDQEGDGFGVFGRRFDVNGTAQGDEFRMNFYTTGDQDAPELAMDGSGNFTAVWSDATQDGSGDGVFGQLLPCARVTDLQVELVNFGEELLFTWTDSAGATGYTVFEDTVFDGPFTTVTGTAPDGLTGLAVPVSEAAYFLVAGTGPTCTGPKR